MSDFELSLFEDACGFLPEIGKIVKYQNGEEKVYDCSNEDDIKSIYSILYNEEKAKLVLKDEERYPQIDTYIENIYGRDTYIDINGMQFYAPTVDLLYNYYRDGYKTLVKEYLNNKVFHILFEVVEGRDKNLHPNCYYVK